jgi:hypothetical protein
MGPEQSGAQLLPEAEDGQLFFVQLLHFVGLDLRHPVEALRAKRGLRDLPVRDGVAGNRIGDQCNDFLKSSQKFFAFFYSDGQRLKA